MFYQYWSLIMINQKATRTNVDNFLKKALPHFLLMRGMQRKDLFNRELEQNQLGKQLFIIYHTFNRINPKYQPLLNKLYYDEKTIKQARKELNISHDTSWKYKVYGLNDFAIQFNKIQQELNIKPALNLIIYK